MRAASGPRAPSGVPGLKCHALLFRVAVGQVCISDPKVLMLVQVRTEAGAAGEPGKLGEVGCGGKGGRGGAGGKGKPNGQQGTNGEDGDEGPQGPRNPTTVSAPGVQDLGFGQPLRSERGHSPSEWPVPCPQPVGAHVCCMYSCNIIGNWRIWRQVLCAAAAGQKCHF